MMCMRIHRPIPLVINNVRKDIEQARVIGSVSLTVQRGEIFGLLGPHGAGKTTLIEIVSGITTPTTGQIKIMGYDLHHHRHSIQRLIGVVSQAQAPEMDEEHSLWRYVEMHTDRIGITNENKQECIATALAFVQLLTRKDALVTSLSSGTKQCLALACVLLHDPQLLILDEPTLEGDSSATWRMSNSLLALRKQGKSIFFTTTSRDLVQAVCDRVGIMENGKIQYVLSRTRLGSFHLL